VLVPLLVLLLAFAGSPTQVGASTSQSFHSVRISQGKAVFKLRGPARERIRRSRVRRAHVRVSSFSRRLRPRRVRRGLRRGVLKVRLPQRVLRRLKRTSSRRVRRRRPKLVVVVTESPSRAPGQGAGSPGSGSEPITSWRPPGSLPLTDAEAASRVSARPEIRPENARANGYRPSDAELQAFYTAKSRYDETTVEYNPLNAYVTGRFSGSTDDILQWAAHKWGIPEDVVRAVATAESTWRHSYLGDRADGVDASRYPEAARIDSDSVYESMGLVQVKWQPFGRLHPGTEPLRWKSTAFNVDYWAATVRYYFEGRCSWCGSGYRMGQEWQSLGGWYNPSPWGNSGMASYIEGLKRWVAERPWERPGF
jgi:hypothetical protein